jgi:hypothetical protein
LLKLRRAVLLIIQLRNILASLVVTRKFLFVWMSIIAQRRAVTGALIIAALLIVMLNARQALAKLALMITSATLMGVTGVLASAKPVFAVFALPKLLVLV